MSWGSMADGFMSRRWQLAQKQYNHWKGRDASNLDAWLGKVIVAILQVVWDQWAHRNTAEHDPQGFSAQALHQELDQAIQEELTTGQSSLPNTVWLQFTQHQATLFHKTTGFKQHWLLNIEAARKQYSSTQQLGYAPERAALKKWISTGQHH